MSTQHTPGPWVWQHWPDGQNTVAERSTLGTIANVWTSGAGVDIDKANARLIAAAPELLAALRDVLRIAKAASIGVTGNAPRIARAEAAIATATGQQGGAT